MHALVVGSGGLGRAIATAIATRPSTTLTVWSRHRPDDLPDGAVHCMVDITDDASIKAAAGRLCDVDMAIVATGVLHDGASGITPEKSWRALDADVLRRMFEINTIAPALVAKHVLPLLPRDRRAVFAALSARVGSIGDNRLGGWHSYRASKAALNQILRCLAIELRPRCPQAICVGLHPGTVDTPLSVPFQSNVAADKLFTPQVAAAQLLAVLDHLTPAQSGRVFDWAGHEITP